MELRILKHKKDYQAALSRVDELFDSKPIKRSAEGEELQVLLLLIKQYEDVKFPVPLPDPIVAIKTKMAERGLKNKDLVGKIGTKGYVSALLNKKKPLTLELARIFHKEFGIPAEVLLAS